MRAGTGAALMRLVNVFGAARPRYAYLFANRRANRMKVLVHDGIGVWLAARRLNAGKFVWPKRRPRQSRHFVALGPKMVRKLLIHERIFAAILDTDQRQPAARLTADHGLQPNSSAIGLRLRLRELCAVGSP